MQTKNLIQAQANVIRITGLTKGSVVKKIEDSSYSSEISYAVVLDLMNDGDKTFIELLEYTKSYGAVNAQIKVYNGDKELNLFPADVEEVTQYFNETITRIEDDIEKAKKDLQKKIEGLEKAKTFVSGELAKTLVASSFEEISQAEFDQKVKQRQELIGSTI